MPTKLESSAGILGALFDSNPLPMAIYEGGTLAFLAVNDAALRAYRYKRDDFLRLTALTLQREDERDRFLAWHAVRDITIHSNRVANGTWCHLCGDGTLMEVEVERSRPFVYQGRTAYLATFFDVSAQNRANELSHANRVLLDTADELIGVTTFSLDLRTGEQENPLRGAPLMDRPGAEAGEAPHSIADQQPFESDFVGRAGGEPRWFHSGTQLVYDEEGTVTHLVGVTADVTERRTLANQLRAHAYRDGETGLPNREAMLHDGMTLRESTTGMLLVHVHAVAGFAERDHELKARIMQEAARVVAAVAGPDAIVARYADDVFAVITTQDARERSMVPLAKQLLAGFDEPLHVLDGETVVIPSVGIAAERGERRDPSLLCHEAECALDVARHTEGHLAVYDDVLATASDRRAKIGKNLRYAIAREQISVAYQPIVSLSTGRIVGAEALMRWDCPGLGSVPPSEFIAVAEESGTILKLGAWIMREACVQARRWQVAGHRLRMAVNVAGRQLKQRDFPHVVRSACDAAALDPKFLELELTEGTMMHYDGAAVRNLQAVRELGARISVDDFGTGYSSLSYLKNLPLDTLKIDRSFTTSIVNDRFQSEVTRSVIRLSHQRGLFVVGEGVETVEQLGLLRGMGCDEVQGYLMSRPVGAATFLGYLQHGLGSMFHLPVNAKGA